MSRFSQILALAKQDFRRNIRSKGIMFIVFLLPIAIWGLQLGMVSLELKGPTTFDHTIYIANQDESVNQTNMGQDFITQMTYFTNFNKSQIYGAKIQLYNITNNSQIDNIVLNNDISPLIVIPKNFTTTYLNYNISKNLIPKVWVYLLPKDNNIKYSIENSIAIILFSPPFSINKYDKATNLQSSAILAKGEERKNPLVVWGAGFFLIYIALFVPGPIISSSFVRERQNRTLEALMALPLKSTDLLLGKILSGIYFIAIFSVMNSIGMIVYSIYVSNASWLNNSEEFLLGISIPVLIYLSLIIFLTSCVALILGIAITSRSKDIRSAESLYNVIFLIPFAIPALAMMITEPTGLSWIYLIPWSHSLALIFKAIFPNTVLTKTITGSLDLDIIFHVISLIVFALISILVTAKLNDKGKIFRLEE